ncbi:unnamed protein product [Closterium sp. NIES-65]|nr:unnamed protein product [Closterium sp. NIES-65]
MAVIVTQVKDGLDGTSILCNDAFCYQIPDPLLRLNNEDKDGRVEGEGERRADEDEGVADVADGGGDAGSEGDGEVGGEKRGVAVGKRDGEGRGEESVTAEERDGEGRGGGGGVGRRVATGVRDERRRAGGGDPTVQGEDSADVDTRSDATCPELLLLRHGTHLFPMHGIPSHTFRLAPPLAPAPPSLSGAPISLVSLPAHCCSPHTPEFSTPSSTRLPFPIPGTHLFPIGSPPAPAASTHHQPPRSLERPSALALCLHATALPALPFFSPFIAPPPPLENAEVAMHRRVMQVRGRENAPPPHTVTASLCVPPHAVLFECTPLHAISPPPPAALHRPTYGESRSGNAPQSDAALPMLPFFSPFITPPPPLENTEVEMQHRVMQPWLSACLHAAALPALPFFSPFIPPPPPLENAEVAMHRRVMQVSAAGPCPINAHACILHAGARGRQPYHPPSPPAATSGERKSGDAPQSDAGERDTESPSFHLSLPYSHHPMLSACLLAAALPALLFFAPFIALPPPLENAEVAMHGRVMHRRVMHRRVMHRRVMHRRVMHRRVMHRRVMHRRVMHRRVMHRRVMHRRVMHRRVMHRRVMHRRVMHRRVMHRRVMHRRVMHRRVMHVRVMHVRVMQVRVMQDIANLTAHLEGDPSNAHLLLERGKAWYSIHRFSEAISDRQCVTLLGSELTNPRCCHTTPPLPGKAWFSIHRFPEAIADRQRCVALLAASAAHFNPCSSGSGYHPSDLPRALLSLGQALHAAGRVQEAVEVNERAAALIPSQNLTIPATSAAATSAEDTSAAASSAEWVTASGAWGMVGLSYHWLPDADKAERAFRLAVEADPRPGTPPAQLIFESTQKAAQEPHQHRPSQEPQGLPGLGNAPTDDRGPEWVSLTPLNAPKDHSSSSLSPSLPSPRPCSSHTLLIDLFTLQTPTRDTIFLLTKRFSLAPRLARPTGCFLPRQMHQSSSLISHILRPFHFTHTRTRGTIPLLVKWFSLAPRTPKDNSSSSPSIPSCPSACSFEAPQNSHPQGPFAFLYFHLLVPIGTIALLTKWFSLAPRTPKDHLTLGCCRQALGHMAHAVSAALRTGSGVELV